MLILVFAKADLRDLIRLNIALNDLSAGIATQIEIIGESVHQKFPLDFGLGGYFRELLYLGYLLIFNNYKHSIFFLSLWVELNKGRKKKTY